MLGWQARRFLTLLWALTLRDIRARYRRSLLGPAWAILQPLLLMVVFTVLSGVLEVDSQDVPYVIFSYSVLVPWTFFSGTVSRAGASIISNASIIKKINVSRELFPLVTILTGLFDALMAGLILAGMMIWFQVPLDFSIIWLLPLLILTGLFTLGVSMFFASVGVYSRDVLQVNTFLMQLWMYATPIIYPISEVPEKWRSLYQLNPMVGLLEGFRNILTLGEAPDLTLLAWSLPGIMLALLVSWPLFRYTSRYFADVL